MSNIVSFASAGLPAVSSLSTALRQAAQNTAPVAGVVILKMDRTGHWVFGADQDEVEPDSTWAINPFSFIHGYIAWGADKSPAAGTVLGEKLAPMTEPLPEVGPTPSHCDGWQVQLGFSLKCMSGEDAGMDARFTTVSLGGKRAVQELALAVAGQAEKDQKAIVPVVKLGKDYYVHKAYGRIFVPVFDVVKWISMDGDTPAQAEEPEAAPADEPRRRRRVTA